MKQSIAQNGKHGKRLQFEEMLLSFDMTSISKIGSLWLQVTEETMQEKGTFETFIDVHTWLHMQLLEVWEKGNANNYRSYANFLLNEKKKPTQNQGQCTYCTSSYTEILTKQPPLTASVEKRKSLHSSLTYENHLFSRQ